MFGTRWGGDPRTEGTSSNGDPYVTAPTPIILASPNPSRNTIEVRSPQAPEMPGPRRFKPLRGVLDLQRRKRTWVLMLILVVTLLLLALAMGPVLRLFAPGPTVTITLLPRTQSEQASYQFTAVTGTPDSTRRQVPARILTASSPTQSATSTISPSPVPATRAHGQLRFINSGATDVTLQSTTIVGKSGVPVTFTGPVVVPANGSSDATIDGFAVNAGAAGNIPQFDIAQACCDPNIVVQNITAFSGGQDATSGDIVQQNDINRTANPLSATLTQSAQTSLQEK